MDLAARTQYLKDIRDLTNRCQSKLESLVTSIGWSVDTLNRNVKSGSSPEHKAEDPETLLKPETLEGNPQLEDFEKRYNDLLSGLPSHSKKGQTKSEAQTLAELLEFERNTKRRRISYKNKVHTKNKSHTEVLRELVKEQMEVLKEISGEDTKEESVDEKPVEDEEEAVGLIQLSFTKGNPHTVWQKIGQMVENRSVDDGRTHRAKADFSREGFSGHAREKSNSSKRRDRSWRCHDDRDSRHSKDRRRDDYARSSSRNRDHRKHRHKSHSRRSSSPDDY